MGMLIWMTLSLIITISSQRNIIVVDEKKVEDLTTKHQEDSGEFSIVMRNYGFSNCSCDSRYNVYYEAKGCKPAHYDTCGCPAKYICDNINEIEAEDKVCQYKDKTYAPGAQITTKNPCEKCHCSEEFMIVCAIDECPQNSEHNSTGICHDIYEVNQCCPINITCIGQDEEEYAENNPVCVYNNHTYPLGAKMYSKDDPCEVCFCTEEWISSNGAFSNCYETHCVLDMYKSMLLKGCAPVYQDDTCCPTDFYCAPSEEFFQDTQTIEPNVDLKCRFFGKDYHVGDSVSISLDDGCLSCTCQVPPDITCNQQTCKPNPNEETCYPYYTSGSGCCPYYECLMNDGTHETISGRSQPLSKREMEDEGPIFPEGNVENSCVDAGCPGNTTCFLYLVNRGNGSSLLVPTCIHTNSSCSVPVCGLDCVVTEIDSSNCPLCLCGSNIMAPKDPLKCRMPTCGEQNCILIAGTGGCPSCSCAGPCPELECRQGCNVITTNEGACPKCVCEDETNGCPTPVCENEGCRIVQNPNGCPTCECGNVNSGRELEDNVGENQNSNMEQSQQQVQQQQQQQQNVMTGEAYGPEPSGETGDDYDSIVFMSGSSNSQSSNMKARPQRNEDYAGFIDNKPFTKLVPQNSWNIFLTENGEDDNLIILKPKNGNDRIKPEP